MNRQEGIGEEEEERNDSRGGEGLAVSRGRRAPCGRRELPDDRWHQGQLQGHDGAPELRRQNKK